MKRKRSHIGDAIKKAMEEEAGAEHEDTKKDKQEAAFAKKMEKIMKPLVEKHKKAFVKDLKKAGAEPRAVVFGALFPVGEIKNRKGAWGVFIEGEIPPEAQVGLVQALKQTFVRPMIEHLRELMNFFKE